MHVGTCDPRPGRLRYAALGALAVCLLLFTSFAFYRALNPDPQNFTVAPHDAIYLMDSPHRREAMNATAEVTANAYREVSALVERAKSPCECGEYARNALAHIRELLKD